MNLTPGNMETIALIISVISGFYRLTKIETNILSEIANINKRLDVHIADHKLIDRELGHFSKIIDNK